MAGSTRLCGLFRQLSLFSPTQLTLNTTVRCASSLSRKESKYNSPSTVQLQIIRNTSFFNKHSADQLWKGVTSVSNAGKKRGRGKGIGQKRAKDLNRGQMIGVGKENIVWPGLNAPIIRGKELVKREKLPKDEERMNEILKLRDNMGRFRPLRLDPLERGWSGNRMPGRSIGEPDAIGEDAFEDFDTKVLETKTVCTMSGIFGRVRRLSMFVITGNGNGLAGFALAKGNGMKSVMRKVKARAAQKLIYIERYNDHTVYHDFYCRFYQTKIFVKRKPAGYGLVCHRAIKTMCEVIGIKDLYAKVEGPSNVQHITKAFFIGLLQQKTHQQLAEEKGLHLVEFREETSNFPKVLCSPEVTPLRKLDQIPPTEELDYNLYTMDGKVELKRKNYPPGYTLLPSWNIHLKKLAKYRNHDKIRLELMAEHDRLCSFYSDQYPECDPLYDHKKLEDQESESY